MVSKLLALEIYPNLKDLDFRILRGVELNMPCIFVVCGRLRTNFYINMICLDIGVSFWCLEIE